MSQRSAFSFRRGHGGSNTAPGHGFCSQPAERWDEDVAYCGGCGWAYAIRCMVPGCTHMRGNRKGSPLSRRMVWICGEHWRAVPRWMKAIYQRASRREDALKAKLGEDSPIVWAAGRARHRLYLRLARAATERAMGLR